MGRKSGSYKFEKRQKELKKQKKKREKMERRQNKGEFDDEPQPTMDFDHPVEGSSELETDTEAETDQAT